MGKYATHSFEISRKILCILLTCVLMLQIGCHSTRVLQSLEREDLKTDEHKRLHLKLGQLVRITYLKESATKTEQVIGRVKSLTSDTIVVIQEDKKEANISFDHIKKIELMESGVSFKDFIIIATLIGVLIYYI